MISSANMFRVVAVINGRCDLRVIGEAARLRALAVVASASGITDASRQVGAMPMGLFFTRSDTPLDFVASMGLVGIGGVC